MCKLESTILRKLWWDLCAVLGALQDDTCHGPSGHCGGGGQAYCLPGLGRRLVHHWTDAGCGWRTQRHVPSMTSPENTFRAILAICSKVLLRLDTWFLLSRLLTLSSLVAQKSLPTPREGSSALYSGCRLKDNYNMCIKQRI